MPITSAGRGPVVEIDGLRIRWAPGLLEPRPWTAHQAAWAAELMRGAPAGSVLELCSGAGHIGLLGVRDHPDRRLVAVDIDPLAAELGAENARAAGLADRVEQRVGALEGALRPGERFAVVIADPPWVPHARLGRFAEDPPLAIDGGVDGLVLARRCLRVAAARLLPGGSCVLQVGTVAQVEELARWLAGAGIPLVLVEMRDHAPRGVLVQAVSASPTDPA